MLGNNPTSNNAIRFGAAILLGTAIAYLIWSTSSSSSSSSQKSEKKEVKKTTKTVISEKKTEVKKATTIESEPTVEATVETTTERTIGKLAFTFRFLLNSPMNNNNNNKRKKKLFKRLSDLYRLLSRTSGGWSQKKQLLSTTIAVSVTRGHETTDHMNAATNKDIEAEIEIATSETEETAPVADITVEVAEIAIIEVPVEVEVEVEQGQEEQEQEQEREEEEVVSYEETAVIEDVITQEHIHEETTDIKETEVIVEKKEIATASFVPKEIMEVDLEVDTPTTLVEEDHYSKVNLNLNSTNNLEESRWTSKRVVDDVQTLAEISLVAQHSELNAQAVEFTPSWSTTPRYVPAPIARPRNPTTRSEEPAKMKSRCRFWPKCTNKSCKFVHPTVYCRDPANCTFGERCVFIHPSDVVRMHETQENGKKNQRRNANRSRRPQSSDSSASMASVSPVESPMK
ncbi:hypothetical protein BGZ81_010290 [Podila clonocystis]|nr:hypothetical protein BGZ81_010290 [Podila clonocystis]